MRAGARGRTFVLGAMSVHEGTAQLVQKVKQER
jgi:hypothetical protein